MYLQTTQESEWPVKEKRGNDPERHQAQGEPAAGGGVTAGEIGAALGATAPPRIRDLLARAHHSAYQAQEVLYHQGNSSDSVFFVTDGLLKLVAYLPNGRARIVRLHRNGSVLGLGRLRGAGNEHTAVAVTPVTALRLSVSTLLRLHNEDPAAYLYLVERWHDYLMDADRWITQFSTGPIRGRVARLLAFLSEFEPQAADGQVQLLTCDEMGSILGVTGESVSRTLAEFKRQEILAREESDGEVYAADVERLRDIGDED
jgi:CRP/FNR family transcriptional regulator